MALPDKDAVAIGEGVPRVDGDEKVRGRAQYVDDLHIPGCWHAWVVRSPVSHGRLRALRKGEDFDWTRAVVVVTPEDIPGPNVFVMHDRSMPVLASGEILYLGEPLAVVAAPTLKLAREAAAHIHADIEELPSVFTLAEIVERFKRGEDGDVRLCGQTIVKGDVVKGFEEADLIVEGEYAAGHQEQMYIEPQGLVAIPQPGGGLFVRGSMQCPYYVVHELREALALPPEKLRVKQEAVGGAFGGKEEFPSMLAAYCTLPAMKSGKPVKIIYDRNQDILYTTKRHPVWVRHKTGLKKDGTITAMHVDFFLDGGAYLTLSDVVMYRGILHAAMGYRCGNVYVNGVVWRTNTFTSGAFRGFGAPQAIWGLESHVDAMAKACKMAPHEFRLKNCLREGDITPTGQVLKTSVGSPAVLEECLKRSGFAAKFKKCSRGKLPEQTWYGIGLSFFGHGAGFTGDGEAKIKSRAEVELDMLSDGGPGVNIKASSTEMGQGAQTVLCQIVADAMSLPVGRVRFPFADTALVPDSGPTVASRTTMVVGGTLMGAALKLREALELYAGETFFSGQRAKLIRGAFKVQGKLARSFKEVATSLLKKHGPMRAGHQFALPADTQWNQKTFEGDAYPGYSWGCNVAEVEVDTLTLRVHVKKVYAVFDIGTVINPVLAKGQIEGGLTQALGYAVMEKIGIRNGRFDADRMQTYIIPTMLDTPEFDVHFVEFPCPCVPHGAKGAGEIPMDGLAPAIANAVEQAVGIRMTHLPITPEDLLVALRAKKMPI